MRKVFFVFIRNRVCPRQILGTFTLCTVFSLQDTSSSQVCCFLFSHTKQWIPCACLSNQYDRIIINRIYGGLTHSIQVSLLPIAFHSFHNFISFMGILVKGLFLVFKIINLNRLYTSFCSILNFSVMRTDLCKT